jgi:multidrug resistance efflux pump
MRSILILLFLSFNLNAETIFVTGSIESKNTQHVVMPLVPSFQGKISEMAEEGSLVKKGDFLLRVDGSGIDSQIDAQVEQLAVFKATSKRDNINLKIQLNQSDIAFKRANTSLKIAQVKAEVPLNYIGELAYKQNQLILKNAEKTYEKAKNDLTESKLKIQNKKQEIKLGLFQKQKKLDYLQETLSRFSIYADQQGYVIYANKAWSGEKIQVGDQLNSGLEVLSVSEDSDLQIVAWINAIDVPKLKNEQNVTLQFDAFLGNKYQGKIIKIASGGEDKQVWGDALYYKATISILDQVPDSLMLGMSALIEVDLQELDNE